MLPAAARAGRAHAAQCAYAQDSSRAHAVQCAYAQDSNVLPMSVDAMLLIILALGVWTALLLPAHVSTR